MKAAHNLEPYVIGPGDIGFAETTFYKFIDWYRHEFLFDEQKSGKLANEGVNMEELEERSIQFEQYIYLRFWESDFQLKQYYQLSSLALGEFYDWFLHIPIHDREGSKHDVIRKQIRDRLKTVCPKFYQLVKDNYLTQIRNAIGHSNYYFLGRGIKLLNYSSDTKAHAPLQSMSYDDWYDRFHRLILLHNETIRCFDEVRDKYKKKTLQAGNRISIRIRTKDDEDIITDLGIRHDHDEWIWRANLNEEDLKQAAV